jgi:predicted nucleotide-binding protein
LVFGQTPYSPKITIAEIFWSYEAADKLVLPNQEKLVAAKNKTYLIGSVQKSKVKGAYICTGKFLLGAQKTTQPAASVSGAMRRRVFVVCGADEGMNQAVKASLERLLLVPVVLCEEPLQGRKIVERFGDYEDMGFAMVLLSPDDFVYGKNEAATKREPKPRQEVVFELGFLLGKLGAANVLCFFREAKGFVPLDFEGVRLVAFDDRDSWKLALIHELQRTGFDVDGNRILK